MYSGTYSAGFHLGGRGGIRPPLGFWLPKNIFYQPYTLPPPKFSTCKFCPPLDNFSK